MKNSVDPNSLAARADALRESMEMTRKELAFLSGTTPQTMGDILKGKRFPKVEVLSSMAKCLGTTMDYLCEGIDIESNPCAEVIPKSLIESYSQSSEAGKKRIVELAVIISKSSDLLDD